MYSVSVEHRKRASTGGQRSTAQVTSRGKSRGRCRGECESEKTSARTASISHVGGVTSGCQTLSKTDLRQVITEKRVKIRAENLLNSPKVSAVDPPSTRKYKNDRKFLALFQISAQKQIIRSLRSERAPRTPSSHPHHLQQG